MIGHNRKITSAVCCHLGCRRSNNEDNYYLDGMWKPREYQDQNREESGVSHPPALFAICDGMGGAQQGEGASRLAVSWLHQCRADFLECDRPDRQGIHALLRLNRKLVRTCREQGVQMGSTVAALAVCRDTVYAFGLGDSRVYLLDSDGLSQLTQDHTLAAEAERLGLTGGKPLPAGSPLSHQLTQYLGMDALDFDPSPCCCDLPLQPGQRFLLCSDGLSGYLDSGQMARLLGMGHPFESAHALVAAALEQGAADNITALVLKIQ